MLHGRIPGGALAIKEPAYLLTHMHLSDNNGNLLNAVNVLFGKDPTKYHIQCKVRLARFEGTDMMEFRDQTVCYGIIMAVIGILQSISCRFLVICLVMQ